MQLFNALQRHAAAHVFSEGPMVFDGRKIAYSVYRLNLGPNKGAQVC